MSSRYAVRALSIVFCAIVSLSPAGSAQTSSAYLLSVAGGYGSTIQTVSYTGCNQYQNGSSPSLRYLPLYIPINGAVVVKRGDLWVPSSATIEGSNPTYGIADQYSETQTLASDGMLTLNRLDLISEDLYSSSNADGTPIQEYVTETLNLNTGAYTLYASVDQTYLALASDGSSCEIFSTNVVTAKDLFFRIILTLSAPVAPPVPITPVSISTTTLPGAFPASAYNLTLAATGGVPPYTWSVAQGTLPTGFTLDPSSGTLVGSGQNEKSNLYSFTAMVTDSQQQTAQQKLSLLVNCSASDTADTDGDGLPDCWETYGVYLNGNQVDLPSMGSSPFRKDIFVYYDWFDNSTGSNHDKNIAIHTHDPLNYLSLVVAAFDQAPVDGGKGINLHLVRGPKPIPETLANENLGTSLIGCAGYSWSAFDQLKPAYVSQLSAVFHYAIFAHLLSTGCDDRSGIARGTFPSLLNVRGQDFIVSLGNHVLPADPSNCTVVPAPNGQGICLDVATAVAGTFMHELGHNLGLHHGGIIPALLSIGVSYDDTSFKPNYLSVMNYWFQQSGLIETKNGSLSTNVVDYARTSWPGILQLNESSLDEKSGIGSGAILGPIMYGTRWSCNGSSSWARDASQDVDWNCNGNNTDYPVSAVLTKGARNEQPSVAVLDAPYDDWSNLVYSVGGIGALGASSTFPDTTDNPDEPANDVGAMLQQTGPPRCPADVNRDNVVDREDLDFVRSHLGSHYGNSNYDSRADLNGDLVIDVRDLAIVARAQGCRVQ